MSSLFSESRDPNCIGSTMCLDVPGKSGEASPAGYTNVKAAQGRPSTRWSGYVSYLAWSRLGVDLSPSRTSGDSRI